MRGIPLHLPNFSFTYIVTHYFILMKFPSSIKASANVWTNGKEKDFVNHRSYRPASNFIVKERSQFAHDIHYRPKVKMGVLGGVVPDRVWLFLSPAIHYKYKALKFVVLQKG